MVGIIPAWVHQPVKSVLPPPVGNQQHHKGSDRQAEHQKQESDRKFSHGSLHLLFDKDRANPLPEKTELLTLGSRCSIPAFWNTNTTFYRICGRWIGPGFSIFRLRSRNTPGPTPNRMKIAPAASKPHKKRPGLPRECMKISSPTASEPHKASRPPRNRMKPPDRLGTT